MKPIPCGHCGEGEDMGFEILPDADRKNLCQISVLCNYCGATGGNVFGNTFEKQDLQELKDMALKEWNRRVYPGAVEAWAQLDENGKIERDSYWKTLEIYLSLEELLSVWTCEDDMEAAKEAVREGNEPVIPVLIIPKEKP